MFVPFKARSIGSGWFMLLFEKTLYFAHIHVSYLSLTFFNVESGGFSLNATILRKLHNFGRAILCAACCHVFPLPSRRHR